MSGHGIEDAARVALVTGASTGIGRATAVELARLGWPIAIGARRLDRLEETADEIRAVGGSVFVHELDVGDATSVDALFRVCEAELGVVDVVVNNAGMSTPGWLHEVPVDAVEREVATNLLGPMLVTQRAVATLRVENRRGDIVFISSDSVRYARPRQSVYAATKAGVELSARSVALELEGTGIRCSTVRVGPTVSEFAADWGPDQLDELMAYWPQFGLQRHFGLLEVTDVARAVVTVVTTRAGVYYDTLEIQPEAPQA